MSRKRAFPLAAILTSITVLAGFACAGGQASGAAMAGGQKQAVEEKERRTATLEFGGERETRFLGTCAVNDEKRTFRGEVPERLEFSPGDGRLKCEIRKEGAGDLKLAFAAGEGTRSLQRMGAPDGEVKIVYEDGNLSISTVSSAGAGSSSKQTIISGSSRSIVSSQQTGP